MANKWLPPWGERSGDVEHFRGFKNQVDSLFEDWFGRSMGGVLAPRLDVTEEDKAVTITAELPGVKENEIEVSLVGDQLTLKGEKRSEHESKEEVRAVLCTAPNVRTARSSGRSPSPTRSRPIKSRLSSRMAF